ncbi:unnamed protein product [[Candida] boidinii]|uniref:Unnamed protein product n=1 Tax=Candida boidinii TaxID=5477 RepID=A0A9W6T4U1_CANBO|nr:unnamed protein product [[Candida] boidinii]GME95402.1 unnamed protein product [[Candida] boidinii]GMF61153.1 unnamed protein product [[Candida] boidinii]GMG18844.1 unnamed protein product [[Candida] boidinii]
MLTSAPVMTAPIFEDNYKFRLSTDASDIQSLSGGTPINPAPARCRSRSAASLSSTGSSAALCSEAYHAAHAGKIDVTTVDLLPLPEWF